MFGVYSDKGYVWRYIPNDRIKFQTRKNYKQESFLDSEAEKGRRIQAMIDKAQTEAINKNKEDITNLKKGSK